jgi:pimeloyl-ACP methyl ester carboxylesterase
MNKVLVGLCFVSAIGAASNALVWEAPCPPEAEGGEACKDVARMQRPLDSANPSGQNITFFIRRYYNTVPTDRALWMLDGGPGFSSHAFAPIALYILTLDSAITVYLADQRGTGLSSRLTCSAPPTAGSFDPYNATLVQQYRACNEETALKYGNISQFFSTHSAAEDFAAAIELINPAKVAIYALSYGTYLINTYLQLPNARANVVVLDGPVPSNRWVLENNAPWVERVSMDVLYTCAQASAACAQHLGQVGLLPRFVMDAIIDGSLPCLKRLPWLSQHVAAIHSSYMTLDGEAHVLLGPFWWRLYRCSDSDVQQLNTFHAYRTAVNVAPPPSDYSYPLAVIVGASEVYTINPRDTQTYAAQVNRTAQVFADASPQLILSLARERLPLYKPNNATYLKFARPTMPVLITVGTLDPNTPHALGVWLRDALGPRAQLVTIPYSAHGTLAYNAPCANSIILNFLLAFGAAAPNLSCLPSIPVPDFDGLTDASKQLSQQLFNTPNLWNDATPVPPYPPQPATTCPSSNDSLWRQTTFALIGISVFLMLLCTYLTVRITRGAAHSALASQSPNYRLMTE